MAIVAGYPKEMRENRDGSADELQYGYTRKFQVIVDNLTTDNQDTALRATGIPRVGNVHPTVSYAYCKRLNVSSDANSPYVFYVTADYETPPRGSTTGDDNPNPIMRPAEYQWSFATQSEPVQFGNWVSTIKVKRDGTESSTGSNFTIVKRYPVLNSARQPFDPLPERQASYPMVRVTKNELAFSAATAVNYVDHVNSDTFGVGGNLALPGQALMASITASRQFENDVYYWQVTYELHYRKDGWTVKLLDRGDKERKLVAAAGGQPAKWTTTPIMSGGSKQGQTLLNGSGVKLPDPATEAPADIMAVYLEYKVYEETPFAPLLL